MPLIECKNCGKKISDTIEVCIHCGEPTKEPQITITNDAAPIAEEVVKTRNYNHISDYERQALEFEFIRQDEEAMKQRMKENDFNRWKNIISMAAAVFSFCFSVIVVLGTPSISVLPIEYIQNHSISFTIAFILDISLFLCIILSRIFLAILKRINKTSRSRFFYIKKYQNWLFKEKKIEYNPIFYSERERILFEKVNINM